jgi:hypothetical protein
MANYLSKPIETLPPTSSINTQLIAQVQGAKQGQYNLAKQQINQTLDAFENLKVLRPQDNAYIEAKLTDLRAKLDNSAYKDLSDINLSDNLMSQIKTAAKDPFIVDAMANTAKFNNFQQQLAQLKEKKPELYNDANYAYAMWKGGVQDYIDGKSNGIGNLSYTNYVNLSEEHLKRLKTLKDIKGKRVIQDRDNNGTIIERSIDGLSEDDIRNYFGSTITPQEMEQMKINGWAKFGQNPQEAQKLVSGYYKENISQIDNKIATREAKLKLNLSPSEKQTLQQEVEALKESKTNFSEGLNNISKIPVDSLALELEKSAYLNGLAEVAKAEWSVEYKKDEAWHASRKLEMDYEELQMKREKHGLEMLKLSQETGMNADGTVNAEITTSTREGDTDETTTIKAVHDQYYNEVLLNAKDVIAKGGNESEYFKTLLRSRGLDENLNWIDPNKSKNQSKAAEIDAVFADVKIKKAFPDQSIAVSKAMIGKKSTAEDLIKLEGDAYLETFNKDADDYIQHAKTVFNASGATEDVIRTGTMVIDVMTGNVDPARKLNRAKLENFVKENGGWEGLKSNLIKKPIKLKQFDELVQTVASESYNAVSRRSLKEDAQQALKTKSQEYGKSGEISTMTAYRTANIANPTVVKSIVNTINSEQYAPDSAQFDTKDTPVSVFRGTNIIVRNGQTTTVPGIWVEQRLGTEGTGDKQKPKFARAFVEKGDAGYEAVNSLIDIEEQKTRGYNVNNPNIKFKTSSPKEFSTKDYEGGINSSERVNDMELVNSYSTSLKLTNGDPFFKYSKSAANLIDDTAIKNTYREVLIPAFGKEASENFINTITSKEIMSSFVVDPVVKEVWIQGTKKKQLSFVLKNRKIDGYSYELATGSSNVDEKLIYLQETFPQTIVAEMLLNNIDKQKAKANISNPMEIFN